MYIHAYCMYTCVCLSAVSRSEGGLLWPAYIYIYIYIYIYACIVSELFVYVYVYVFYTRGLLWSA